MRLQDQIMLTLYLMAFALGIEISIHGLVVGYFQVILIAALFPLRLQMALRRQWLRDIQYMKGR